jgi:hypothetical protein
MSTDTQADDVVAGKKRRGPQPRRRIELPDGDWLEPRSEFAAAIRITPPHLAEGPRIRRGGHLSRRRRLCAAQRCAGGDRRSPLPSALQPQPAGTAAQKAVMETGNE